MESILLNAFFVVSILTWSIAVLEMFCFGRTSNVVGCATIARL